MLHIDKDPGKLSQLDEIENIKIESCRLRNSNQHFCPPLLVIIAKCDELSSSSSMLQEGDHNERGEPTSTLFSTISVGYDLGLCVTITFLHVFSFFYQLCYVVFVSVFTTYICYLGRKRYSQQNFVAMCNSKS